MSAPIIHKVFYRSGLAMLSESFSLSSFVLQHQEDISTPQSPSPSAFSKSSLQQRPWGETMIIIILPIDKLNTLVPSTQIYYRTNNWRFYCLSSRVPSMESVVRRMWTCAASGRAGAVCRNPVYTQRYSRNFRLIFADDTITPSCLHEWMGQCKNLHPEVVFFFWLGLYHYPSGNQ